MVRPVTLQLLFELITLPMYVAEKARFVTVLRNSRSSAPGAVDT